MDKVFIVKTYDAGIPATVLETYSYDGRGYIHVDHLLTVPDRISGELQVDLEQVVEGIMGHPALRHSALANAMYIKNVVTLAYGAGYLEGKDVMESRWRAALTAAARNQAVDPSHLWESSQALLTAASNDIY